VDYDARRVWVDQAIVYPNLSGVPLSELVLAVEPMRYDGAFKLIALSLAGMPVSDYLLDSHRLIVPLALPLPAGRQVELVLQYELALPPKRYDDIFGWTADQINLTDWYPFIVPYDTASGWLLHDPMPWGEHLVYDWANYEVYLRFTEPAAAPMVAAPALAEAHGEWTRYRLDGARTFALSMSRRFLVRETAVRSTVVRSYFFAEHKAAGEKIAYVATQALGLFEPLFAPYPYPVLNVVETEHSDGQEFDGLAFLSSNFYATYNGGSRNNLVVIGVHEIAHNWWFGLVGNDQALEPWLDEALAVYSERIFFEYTNPGLLDWWWRFRVTYFNPRGWVDATIYNGGSFRDYTDAVYFNGALFLEKLRIRMGDKAFLAFLKDYARQMAYGRATARNFFQVARQHSARDFSDLIRAYFSTSE